MRRGRSQLLGKLLSDQMRALGADHIHTLTTRNKIAGWRGQTGDAPGAAAELLEDMARVLGPNHPGTVTTRHNLAHWQGKAGEATFDLSTD